MKSLKAIFRRQKEHGSSSGGAGEDLSRASSISNLNAADSNKVGSRGALAKVRKSISKDRLDVSGVKSEKKGGNKNNNQPEQHVADTDELIALRQQLDAMAGEKSNLMLQLGDQRGQLSSLQKEIARLKMFQEQSSVQLEQLNDENAALRNKLRDVVHSPLSDNEKQMLLLDSTHRHHSSAPASIAANLLSDSGGGGGDVTTCSTPDWDKQSSSNVSEVSVACLQDKINQMQETHYSTNEELQATLQELTDLQRQLTELQQDNEHLLEEKNLMFDSLCRQTERLNDARSEIESLKQLLYRDKDESGQYEGVVEREQKLVDLLKGAQEERELLLLKQEQLTNELQEVRALHSQAESDNAQLTERVRTLESTLDAKHAEHRQLDQDLARAKDKASSRQIEIDRLTDLLENARTKIAELEQDRALSDKSELDELLDNARKEKDALESEVSHLKEQVARGRNEGEKLREQVSILQEECKVLRNNAKCTQSELEYKVEKLNGEKAGLVEQLQRFEEAANELQVQAQCHLEDKRQLSSVLSETQRNMSEVERHSQDLEAEVKELKKLRSEENEEWEKFQNDLLTSVRVANDFKTEAQQELQKLVMENKAHRDKIRQLEGQVEKLKERVDSALEYLSSAIAASNLEVSVSTAGKPEDSPSLVSDLSGNVSSVHSSSPNVTSVRRKGPLGTDNEEDYVASVANVGPSDLPSVTSVDGLICKQEIVTSPGSAVSLERNSKDETFSIVSSASSLDSERTGISSSAQDAKEMYYLDYINEQYSKIDLTKPFERLTHEEQFILKLKQGYDRHLAQPRAKPLRHKHGVAISKPLLSSIYANPTLKTIYDSSEYLNVETLNQKSKSTGDLSRSEAKKDFVRQHLEHRVSEMSEYQDSVLIDDEDNLSYSEPNLVELYSKIDKTKPEHLLSKEERYVVRLKASMDKLGRKATLKKKRLNRSKVGISSPVIESVLSNENLAQIVRDPNISSVKGEDNSDLHYEDNVDLRYGDSAYILNQQLRIEDNRISTDSNVYSYHVPTGEVKQTFSTFGKSKSIDGISFNFKGTPAASGEVNYPTITDDTTAGKATNFHLEPRPREPPDFYREATGGRLYEVIDDGMVPRTTKEHGPSDQDEARSARLALRFLAKRGEFVTSAQSEATSSPELYAVITKNKSKPRLAGSAEKVNSFSENEATLPTRSSAPDIYAVVSKGNLKTENSSDLGFVASAQNEASVKTRSSAPDMYAVVTKNNSKSKNVSTSARFEAARSSAPEPYAVVTEGKSVITGLVPSAQIEATTSLPDISVLVTKNESSLYTSRSLENAVNSKTPVVKGTIRETEVTRKPHAANYQRISPNFVKFPSFFEKPHLAPDVKPILDEGNVSSVRTTYLEGSEASLATQNCRSLDTTAVPSLENSLSSISTRLPGSEDKPLLENAELSMRIDSYDDIHLGDSNVSSSQQNITRTSLQASTIEEEPLKDTEWTSSSIDQTSTMCTLQVPTVEDESGSSRKTSTSSSNQSSESVATIVPRTYAQNLTDEEVELIRRIRVSCSSPLSDLDCEDRSLIEYAKGALDEVFEDDDGSKITGICEDNDKRPNIKEEDLIGEDVLENDFKGCEFEDLDLKEESRRYRFAKPADDQFNIVFNFEDGRQKLEDLQVLGQERSSGEFIGFENHTKKDRDSEVADREQVRLHQFEDHVDEAGNDVEDHQRSKYLKRGAVSAAKEDHADFKLHEVQVQINQEFVDHPDCEMKGDECQTGDQHCVLDSGEDQKQSHEDHVDLMSHDAQKQIKSEDHVDINSDVWFVDQPDCEVQEDQTLHQHYSVDGGEDQSALPADPRGLTTNKEHSTHVDLPLDHVLEYLAATKECDLEQDYSPQALSSFIFNYRRVVGSLKKKFRSSCDQFDMMQKENKLMENVEDLAVHVESETVAMKGLKSNELDEDKASDRDQGFQSKAESSKDLDMELSKALVLKCNEEPADLLECDDLRTNASENNQAKHLLNEEEGAVICSGNKACGSAPLEDQDQGSNQNQHILCEEARIERLEDLGGEAALEDQVAPGGNVAMSEVEDQLSPSQGDKAFQDQLLRTALDSKKHSRDNVETSIDQVNLLKAGNLKEEVLNYDSMDALDSGEKVCCEEGTILSDEGQVLEYGEGSKEKFQRLFEDQVLADAFESWQKARSGEGGSKMVLEDVQGSKETFLKHEMLDSLDVSTKFKSSALVDGLGSMEQFKNGEGKKLCTVDSVPFLESSGGFVEKSKEDQVFKVVDASTEFEDKATALGFASHLRKTVKDERTIDQVELLRNNVGSVEGSLEDVLGFNSGEFERVNKVMANGLGRGKQIGSDEGKGVKDEWTVDQVALLGDKGGFVERSTMDEVLDVTREFKDQVLATGLGRGLQTGSDTGERLDQVTLPEIKGGCVEGSKEDEVSKIVDASMEFEDQNLATASGREQQVGNDEGKRVALLGDNRGRVEGSLEDGDVVGCNAGLVDKTLEYREDQVDALKVGEDEAVRLDGEEDSIKVEDDAVEIRNKISEDLAARRLGRLDKTLKEDEVDGFEVSKAWGLDVLKSHEGSDEAAKVGVAPKRPVPRPRILQSSKLTVKGSRSVSGRMDEPGNSESFPSSGTVACSNSEGEKLSSGAVPKAVKSSSFETGGPLDDVASAASAVTADMSMENLYESNSSSDDFQIEASYGDLFKRPEDKIFESLTPVREKRELFTVTVKPPQQPKPEERVASSEKVALLKRRFEEAGRLKPDEEAGLDVGHAFHDINKPTPRPLAPLKLDISQSEIKLQEENLDVDSKTSVASAAREGEPPRRKSHIETGTSRESFELAKKMFERGAK